ncbi:MAG: hypothetical protein AB7P02_21345 [Alphaproteobacteria bacterium]
MPRFTTVRRMMGLIMLGLLVPIGANADWVIIFKNDSDVPTKAVIQNIGIHYLRAGQVSDFRLEGYFYKEPIFSWETGASNLPRSIVANFEHLDRVSSLCVWHINWELEFAKRQYGPPIELSIWAKLGEEAPGYECKVSGEMHRRNRLGIDTGGATMLLEVRKR